MSPHTYTLIVEPCRSACQGGDTVGKYTAEWDSGKWVRGGGGESVRLFGGCDTASDDLNVFCSRLVGREVRGLVQLCVIQLLTIWTFANATVCFASECWGGKSEGWWFDCDTPFDDLDVFTLYFLSLIHI